MEQKINPEKLLKYIKIAVAVIGALIVILVLMLLFNPSYTPQNIPEDTTYQQPVETPEQTSVEEQPAPVMKQPEANTYQESQPEQTPVEEPTRTLKDIENEEEITKFKTELGENALDLGDQMAELGALLQSPKFSDLDWKMQTASCIVMSERIIREGLNIKTPTALSTELKKGYSLYRIALKNYSRGLKTLPDGVDNLDPEILATGLDYIEKGNQYFREATKTIGN